MPILKDFWRWALIKVVFVAISPSVLAFPLIIQEELNVSELFEQTSNLKIDDQFDPVVFNPLPPILFSREPHTEPTVELLESSPSKPKQDDDDSLTELAKKVQNPIADLINIRFQNDTNGGIEPLKRVQNTLDIKPIIPLSLNPDWLLITRTDIPITYQPLPEGGSILGLGDLNPQLYFSPQSGHYEDNQSSFTWGFGPSIVLPTATNRNLGKGKWSLGPAVIAVMTKDRWVMGAVGSQVWSVFGDSDRPWVSMFTVQPFVNYNLTEGWYLVSSPIITADWQQAKGNQWTVPLGGGLGKVLAIGEQKMNITLQFYWNITKPQQESDWTLRTQFELLYPR